ncbi:MAG: hypothetical protein J6P84_03965 [Alphaproteobacteria bacterium]|nr:hypothetical protein [Alphaproteobacteria bacterium]MBO7453908.1 hypothetical protein [Alphaproteobacteria bacterium]MBO7537079.1 hypothetical protein [Alphaproteobacteria bacterium]MCR4555544.1 hypothetical protein [Alphaproteobacteria bacterium]MCR4624127.1 hypothetical protein [Alphaproteobacteria bacterium]
MLSKQSVDILIDLVEIKLSAILIQDKDDVREVNKLKHCKNELLDFKKTFSSRNRIGMERAI